MQIRKSLALASMLTAAFTLLAGCAVQPSQSGGTGTSPAAPQMTGKLQINLTDAPAKEEIEKVWLTVKGVSIHVAGNETDTPKSPKPTNGTTPTETENDNNWLTLPLVGDSRFNLLELQNGLQTKLAVGNLTAGKYTQIRMDVTKVEIQVKGDAALKEAKLPSNTLKFVHPFNIVAGQTTEILFDFNAEKSINVTGNGQYMCKPVIQLSTTKEPGKGAKEPEKFEITTPSLPNGENGTTYETVTFATSGGTAPYTWSVSSGSLPAGLSLNGTSGTLSGTPTAAGDFTFTVEAEDVSNPVKKSATKSFTVNIAAAGALQIVTTNLPSGAEQVAYPSGVVVKVIGGNGNYTWSVMDGGNLPAGLSLNGTTGVIAGTPTAKGDYNFTVKVMDNATPTANSDTQPLTIHINKATP